MGNPVPYPALAAALARTGTEQKDIAELLGFHPSMITKRMRGDVEWRLGELQAIAAHLGVPVSALIDDEPAPAASAAS